MEISNFELLRSGMDRELNILSENETENIFGGEGAVCLGSYSNEDTGESCSLLFVS